MLHNRVLNTGCLVWHQLPVGYLRCLSGPRADHRVCTRPSSCSNRYQDQEGAVDRKGRGRKERKATVFSNLKPGDNRSRLLPFAKSRNTSLTISVFCPNKHYLKSLPTWLQGSLLKRTLPSGYL